MSVPDHPGHPAHRLIAFGDFPTFPDHDGIDSVWRINADPCGLPLLAYSFPLSGHSFRRFRKKRCRDLLQQLLLLLYRIRRPSHFHRQNGSKNQHHRHLREECFSPFDLRGDRQDDSL